MVMAEHVKITKKVGNQEVSVDVFETYTTLETGHDITVTAKDIVLTALEDAPAEGRDARALAGHALRGEDYPALVKVWDNEVDAAVYDKD